MKILKIIAFLVIGGLVLLIGLMVLLSVFVEDPKSNSMKSPTEVTKPSSTNEEVDPKGGKERMYAYNMATDFVKKQLKSPSTAKFPGTFEKNEHIKYLGNNKYKIDSWVDSQNSFGAIIRTHFYCTMVMGEDNVICEGLRFEK